jgi:hypothetical protein
MVCTAADRKKSGAGGKHQRSGRGFGDDNRDPHGKSSFIIREKCLPYTFWLRAATLDVV